MQILDGKIASQSVKENLKIEIAKIADNRPPHLAAILIGNNGASETYVASKIKNCEETGFKSSLIRMPEDRTEDALIEEIVKLNNDETVDGILVQLPLPQHIDEHKIINLIAPHTFEGISKIWVDGE